MASVKSHDDQRKQKISSQYIKKEEEESLFERLASTVDNTGWRFGGNGNRNQQQHDYSNGDESFELSKKLPSMEMGSHSPNSLSSEEFLEADQSSCKTIAFDDDVIIISSDDESSTTDDEIEIKKFKEKLKTTCPKAPSTEPNDSVTLSSLDFGKEKAGSKPINHGSWSQPTVCSKHFISQKQQPKESNHGFQKMDLASSPIAKAFYSNTRNNPNEDVSVRICVSPPLKPRLDVPRMSSLQPNYFSSSQMDFLESFADDSMFFEAYLNTVSSFSSATIAPPPQVMQHILSQITLNANEAALGKAINTLNNMFSIRILSSRNLPLTWEFLCDLFDRLFNNILRPGIPLDSTLFTNRFQTILHIVNLLEQDFKRFYSNLRCTLVWKMVSPSIYGRGRLGVVSQWFTHLLSFAQDDEVTSAEGNNTRNFPFSCAVKVLQRLANLMFLSSRNRDDFSQTMAEMFYDCFFVIRPFRLRKQLLQSIENAMVQRKTVALILSRICEDSPESSEHTNRRLSLETIVYCYLYKVPPRKQEHTGHHCSQEEAEEFVFLLYLLVRSYLAMNRVCARESMSVLSILQPTASNDGHELPLQDRETLLTIMEELSKFEDRLAGYLDYEEFGNRTKMYLRMLSRQFEDAYECLMNEL